MAPRTSLLLAAAAATCLTWAACTSQSSPEVTVDAGVHDASGGASDAPLAPDDFVCNPCQQVCPCTPGDTFYSPAACTTFVCPASGTWGGNGCLGPGCVDATDVVDVSQADSIDVAQPDAVDVSQHAID